VREAALASTEMREGPEEPPEDLVLPLGRERADDGGIELGRDGLVPAERGRDPPLERNAVEAVSVVEEANERSASSES
jgi:hypothetical protein